MMKWKKEKIPVKDLLWNINAFVTALVPPLGALMTALMLRGEYRKHEPGYYYMDGVGQGVMLFDGVETLFCLICMVTVDVDVWIVAVWFFLGVLVGLWMLLAGKNLAKQDRMHKVMHTVVHVSHITQVENMASVMGVRQDVIREAFDRMIRWGVLKNAQFDPVQNKLLLPEEKWADAKVVCKECGAELVINIGQTLVCPYCKTAL